MARRATKRADAPSAPVFLSPLWKKAPLALLRFRPAFLAIVFAAGIVATTAAAYPLFISSISSAALETQVAGRAAWPAGLQVTSTGALSHPRRALRSQQRASRALHQVATRLPALRDNHTPWPPARSRTRAWPKTSVRAIGRLDVDCFVWGPR